MQHADWVFQTTSNIITCTGAWTTQFCARLLERTLSLPKTSNNITIDGSGILLMDSSGAWVLQKMIQKLIDHKVDYQLHGFDDDYLKILNLLEKKAPAISHPPQPFRPNIVYKLGKYSVDLVREGIEFLSFTGELTTIVTKTFRKSSNLQWKLTLNTIDHAGFRALGIVGLLSLLIGVVLTYQMGLQLETYGASVYVVDLLGFSILREFGPLITAIIVAGRTASSFTAEIGTMKINEEIDAMRTMGLPPAQLLVLPKVIGLVIALPLLTIWADIFGLLGGMMMSHSMLGITFSDFLSRFHQDIRLQHLMVGLSKTPVFALLIATVGCFQGFQVQGSADSIGIQTTKSVVLSIFLVIVADAVFSVIFSMQGI